MTRWHCKVETPMALRTWTHFSQIFQRFRVFRHFRSASCIFASMSRTEASIVSSSSWSAQAFVPSDISISPRFGSALHLIGNPLDVWSRRALVSLFGVSSSSSFPSSSASTPSSPVIQFHHDIHSMNLRRRSWRSQPTAIVPDFFNSNPGTLPDLAGRADVGSCVVGQNFDKIFVFGMAF